MGQVKNHFVKAPPQEVNNDNDYVSDVERGLGISTTIPVIPTKMMRLML